VWRCPVSGRRGENITCASPLAHWRKASTKETPDGHRPKLGANVNGGEGAGAWLKRVRVCVLYVLQCNFRAVRRSERKLYRPFFARPNLSWPSGATAGPCHWAVVATTWI
jgi:hypothetical protein